MARNCIVARTCRAAYLSSQSSGRRFVGRLVVAFAVAAALIVVISRTVAMLHRTANHCSIFHLAPQYL